MLHDLLIKPAVMVAAITTGSALGSAVTATVIWIFTKDLTPNC